MEWKCRTPENHVWELKRQEGSSYAYLFNKVTGEVRKYKADTKTFIIPTQK